MPIALQPEYVLRWAFEYADGKRRAGIWGQSTDNPGDSAWAQPKIGLIRAIIEGKNQITKNIVRFAECSGEDYRVFQWVAVAAMPGFGFRGSVNLPSRLVGLKLLARDQMYEVHGNGKVVITPITDRQREIQFASY